MQVLMVLRFHPIDFREPVKNPKQGNNKTSRLVARELLCRSWGTLPWRRNFSYRLVAVAMMKNDEIPRQDPGRRMEKRQSTD